MNNCVGSLLFFYFLKNVKEILVQALCQWLLTSIANPTTALTRQMATRSIIECYNGMLKKLGRYSITDKH